MSKNLQSAIRQLADSFAEGVLEIVRSSSLEELLSNNASGQSAGARANGAAARKAAPVSTGAKRGRPASTDSDEAIERIVSLLKKKPKGLRSEALRSQLRLDKPVLQRATTKAIAANLITKTGEKRATTYFAK